jgi:hypothetical protein
MSTIGCPIGVHPAMPGRYSEVSLCWSGVDSEERKESSFSRRFAVSKPTKTIFRMSGCRDLPNVRRAAFFF